MIVVFVCGPYRGEPRVQIRHIARAREAARWLWGQGYAVICPHTNSGWFDNAAPEEVFLYGYRELVGRSDMVVVVDGWERSPGALGELKLATTGGIPLCRFDPGDDQRQPCLRPLSPADAAAAYEQKSRLREAGESV